MHVTFFLIFDLMRLRGVCFCRDVRSKSFLHEINYEYVLRAAVCFGLLVGTSKNLGLFSLGSKKKKGGAFSPFVRLFSSSQLGYWKCWRSPATGCWRSARFFACLLLSFRGKIWLEEIVLNVLGLMIHDGKCDHRNWGYYGKEHVQSSCAYHRFYYSLVPLPTILG